jgi:TPR repeat protein
MKNHAAPAVAAVLAALLATSLSACGGTSNVGAAVQPKATTANEALGEDTPAKCRAVSAQATPLVVDWKSSERVDLEAAMKDGVVVVKYDCQKLSIVKGCKRRGAYSFAPVQRKEETLQLASSDEVQANVPLGLATFGAAMKRGSTIDIGLVLVGKKSAAIGEVVRSDLEGSCEGATHVVRGASVGAFSVGTGQRGAVRAVADLFGKSVQGASDASRASLNRDGDIEACRTSKSDAASPPDQCQSPVRLELEAITEKAPAKAEATPSSTGNGPAPAARASDPCPEGASFQGGKCATSTAKGYVCKRDDVAECKAQCEAGNAVSCYREALAIDFNARSKDGKLEKGDPVRAEALYTKACAQDYLPACYMKGRTGLIFKTDGAGKIVPPGVPRDPSMTVATWTSTCERGDGQSCAALANLYARGTFVEASEPRATELYTRACELGEPAACGGASYRLFKKADPASVKKGMTLLEASCAAGDDYNCRDLAMHHLKGDVSPRDEARGLELFELRCKRRGPACAELADAYAKGELGLKKDTAKALKLYVRACEPNDGSRETACERAADALEDAKLGAPDLTKATTFRKAACIAGDNACAKYAEALAAGRGTKKDVQEGLAVAERACKVNAAYACATYATLLAKHDPKKARPYLEARCKDGSLQDCDVLKKLR